ncbi:hypothetical protein [Bradyrhizobium yuanmingense]|uniref:hypothetical protein n=1 Tax=Bradyrhizobium yuanmingense TaxID=108015 RepID=UPI0023B8B316|nr:hypothetical protein [Bradyrhizobium yuanmingense]MDF0584956.1 hypothetical protein [Bradyrhizobium yuanmingense]
MVRWIVLAGICLFASPAFAQTTDCNELARDNIVAKTEWQRTDYGKLLFLSRLTQMDVNSGAEALKHSGQVAVGPIKIGPGTWSKERQQTLRSELDKFVSIDQLTNSAASMMVSSGDAVVAKVVSDCIEKAGGLKLTAKAVGTETAIVDMMWIPFPGGGAKAAALEDFTIVGAAVQGGVAYTKKGASLQDRIQRSVTLNRKDPKKDLTVVVNTSFGSKNAYLPPAILPAPPPKGKLTTTVEDEDTVAITSGGGGRGPYCQLRKSKETCAKPKNGGKLVTGSGRPAISTSNGETNRHVGWTPTQDTPERYCGVFWASTTACEVQVGISGRATATEEYLEP